MNAIITLLIFAASIAIAMWLFRYTSRRMATQGRSRAARWSAAGAAALVALIIGLAVMPTPETGAMREPSSTPTENAVAQSKDSQKHQSSDARQSKSTEAGATGEPHLSVAIDDFENRVNDKLKAMNIQQLFRLRRLQEGQYGGSANDNAAVMLGTTSDNAYVESVTVTFSGKPIKRDNANAKTIAVAIIAVAEPTDLDTARSIYNNLVDGVRRHGRADAHLQAVYRLVANSPPAILTIKPE